MFPGNLSFDQWREKWNQDRYSLVADPLFADPKNDDFQLNPNSPALKIGFQAFDTTKASRQDPPNLTRHLPNVLPAFR